MVDILDKDYEKLPYRYSKTLKGDVEKVKEIMCKQNGNISKEKQNPRRSQNKF